MTLHDNPRFDAAVDAAVSYQRTISDAPYCAVTYDTRTGVNLPRYFAMPLSQWRKEEADSPCVLVATIDPEGNVTRN